MSDGRPRVVFVVYQTHRDADGGVESITRVIEGLRRVEPIVVTQLASGWNERWRSAGCDVRVWPMEYEKGAPARTIPQRLQRISSFARTNVRIRKLIRETSARVVHCNDIQAMWHCALGARLSGAASVFNIRALKRPSEQYDSRWSLAIALSEVQIVLSREMRSELLRRIWIPARYRPRMEVIHSVVDVPHDEPASPRERARIKRRLGLPPDRFTIGVVGAVDPRKGQLEFIENCGTALARSLPRSQVCFIGDYRPAEERYAALCEQAVRRLGLEEHLSFRGFKENPTDWYRAFDVVAMTSHREGLARSMIESLAQGTPVVAIEVCSAREILERGPVGIVVDRGNYRALVEALQTMRENEELRQEMGHRGIELARELFDAEEIVRRYEEVYKRLSSSGGPARRST